MKILKSIYLAAVVTAGFSAVAAEQNLKDFKAGYLPSAEQVLYFVAKEKDFFKKEGLNVELFRFTNSAEGLAAVKGAKLDAGFFGTAAPLAFIAKGADFTIIGGGGGEGAALVARADNAEKYKELKDLKDAKIGVVRLATGDVVFRAALHQAGLDWRKDLTFKEFDSPAVTLEALKKGELDAAILWIPYYTLAQKQGLKIIKYSGEVLKGHTCCRQTALTSAVNAKKEDFVKFITALDEAYRFYLNNKDETVDIVSKYIQVPKDVIREDLYGGHLVASPDPGKSSVIQFWGFMKDANYIDQSAGEIDSRVNTDIYEESLAVLKKREPNEPVWKTLDEDLHKDSQLKIKTY